MVRVPMTKSRAATASATTPKTLWRITPALVRCSVSGFAGRLFAGSVTVGRHGFVVSSRQLFLAANDCQSCAQAAGCGVEVGGDVLVGGFACEECFDFVRCGWT